MFITSIQILTEKLPLLATLDLLDLSRLTNDPINHAPFLHAIPAKLSFNILELEGKLGEDLNNHVMTFYLWRSSNSLMNDSIFLRIFQRTLTGATMKWYIELPRNSFVDFNYLSMDFLMHFQFPIQYVTGTKLFTSLRKSSSTHISGHIHEWRQQRPLIKDPILYQLLVDWFTKSLFPPITYDVAMGNVVTEENSILYAQYLDLVYSQFGTLYDLIPNAPCLLNDPTRLASDPIYVSRTTTTSAPAQTMR
jgi:hypothetical protein